MKEGKRFWRPTLEGEMLELHSVGAASYSSLKMYLNVVSCFGIKLVCNCLKCIIANSTLVKHTQTNHGVISQFRTLFNHASD